ncbi:MAG: anthranilate phosphoribosyltransferase [Acidobacteriota bacterium]
MAFLPFLHKVTESKPLTEQEAEAAMHLILTGHAAPVPLAAFLAAYRVVGLSGEDITGFARALRAHLTPVPVSLQPGEVLLDTCGTGGDGTGTFNISTVTAFVVAGAGVKVGKHGNRSVSSVCGSADILEALGVPIHSDPARMAADIERAGFAFLFAAVLHPGMKHVAPVRAELKMRTLFNLLGPLANPASASVQLIGAPSVHDASHLAHALYALGNRNALVVHGSDGLDELTTTGPSTVFRIADAVHQETWQPEDFGLPRASLADLLGGDRLHNAAIAAAILSNQDQGPKRDIVLLNAAAALSLARRLSPRDSIAAARASLDSGAALGVLRALQNRG